MKYHIGKKAAAFCLAAMFMLSMVIVINAGEVTVGSEGSEVRYIQSALIKLGLFDHDAVTGYYGEITANSVKKFQKKHDLAETGVVDDVTMAKLKEIVPDSTEKFSAELTEGKFGTFDWYEKAQYIFEKGTDALVTDVLTGRSFYIRRTFGSQHADTEPLTAADAAIIKEVWGGEWSWNRRAVIVTIGEYDLAASMTAYPHAGRDDMPPIQVCSGLSGGEGTGQNLDMIKGNGISGVMCVHFSNSKNHGGGVQKNHQDAVEKAADYLNSLWIKQKEEAQTAKAGTQAETTANIAPVMPDDYEPIVYGIVTNSWRQNHSSWFIKFETLM